MDILKWNKETNAWEIPLLGTDKLDGGFITPTFSEDVVINNSDCGVVLYSPNGTIYRVTVDNSGTLVITETTP
jgi:hypothetical protein